MTDFCVKDLNGRYSETALDVEKETSIKKHKPEEKVENDRTLCTEWTTYYKFARELNNTFRMCSKRNVENWELFDKIQ